MKNQNRFSVVGSKVEQIKLFESLQIKYPGSEIVQAGKVFSETWSFPLLVKGERGEGELEVAFIKSKEQLQEFSRGKSSQFLIQQIIKGAEYNVDASFRKGNLVFACTSISKAAMWKFGPCAVMECQRKIPKQIENDLKEIGKQLLFDGITNISYIRQESSGE